MKLSYRGIQFQSAPSVSTSSLDVTGKYRGTEFHFSPAASAPFNSALPLQYRGITYLGIR